MTEELLSGIINMSGLVILDKNGNIDNFKTAVRF